jgi:hypothetical protein
MVANNQVIYGKPTATASNWVINTSAKDRCGEDIPAPNDSGAYNNTTVGCSGTDTYAPIELNDAGQNGEQLYPVALLGYYFVNEFAYGPYEPGCHNDQVYGWYTDLSTGELQLFTPTDGVPTNATRNCLYNQDTLSSTQKSQLKVLNRLYKLSKSAVKEINGIPSQEGNIVEVCDCKGQRWLLYIDTAAAQNGSPLQRCNTQFAIVATKLC